VWKQKVVFLGHRMVGVSETTKANGSNMVHSRREKEKESDDQPQSTMAFSGTICNPWQTHINLWLFASQCSGFIPIGAASGGTSTWWVQASEVVWKFVPLLSWIWITGCGLREMLPSRVCSTVFPNWNQHLAARVFFSNATCNDKRPD
jgi:hypothetical protein